MHVKEMIDYCKKSFDILKAPRPLDREKRYEEDVYLAIQLKLEAAEALAFYADRIFDTDTPEWRALRSYRTAGDHI